MRALLFFLSLQQPSDGVIAARADTAFVRDQLMRGVAELVQFPAGQGLAGEASAFSLLDFRYTQQFRLWGLRTEGTGAVPRIDGRRPQRADYRPFPQTAMWIAWLFADGDSAGAEALIRQIPATHQDGVLASAAHSLGQDHPSIADYLASRIESPLLRAGHHAQRAVFLSGQHDTLGARAALAEAAATARRDTSWHGNLYAASWDVERYLMGDSITVGDIVRRAVVGRGDDFQMVHQIVEDLSRRRRIAEAMPLIDSLLAVAASDATPRGANRRAALIELRGTRDDTLRARAIRDSLELARRSSSVAGAVPGPAHESDYVVWTAVQERDLATMTRVLTQATRAARTEHVVANWIQYVRAAIEHPPGAAPEPQRRDSVIRFGRSVYDTTWQLVTSWPSEGRDSVRVALITLRATWDATGALAVARRLPTPRFRERAVAAAAVRMAPLDLDAAIAAAESLSEAVARNVANETLAIQALSAGRLDEGGRFADRTSGGEPRVRSQLAVARAYRAAGQPDAARRRIRNTIALVDPVWFGIPIWNVHTDSLPPAPVGMTNRVIGDVILLALMLGLRDDVVAWAESQPDVERRAAARIVVVEAMSQWRLGWRPYYPMH